MSRPNPFGPPPLDQDPSVRFAVRAWALYQCLSAVVLGGGLLALLLGALVEGIQESASPPPPPKPKLLILRENHLPRIPEGGDPPTVFWGKTTPPPKGFAYDEHYYLLKLPAGLKSPPTGYTYTDRWELVRIPGRLITNEHWRPAPEMPGDTLELRGVKRRPPAEGYAYDKRFHLVKVPDAKEAIREDASGGVELVPGVHAGEPTVPGDRSLEPGRPGRP